MSSILDRVGDCVRRRRCRSSHHSGPQRPSLRLQLTVVVPSSGSGGSGGVPPTGFLKPIISSKYTASLGPSPRILSAPLTVLNISIPAVSLSPAPHSHTAAKSTILSRTETGCWNSQIAEDNPAIGSSDRAKNTRKILGGFTQCECREARRRHADAVSKCGCPNNNSIADIRINMRRGKGSPDHARIELGRSVFSDNPSPSCPARSCQTGWCSGRYRR